MITNVGILGGGQLARMLILAGAPLGIRFRVFDPSPEAGARALSDHFCASYSDEQQLRRFAEGLDVITFEFENVPATVASLLQSCAPVAPPAEALRIGQDRLLEKELFRRQGIPTVAYRAVSSRAELEQAVADLGLPVVVKTRTLGYDGKGQRVINQSSDVDTAWGALARSDLIVERFTPFRREISVIGVRSRDGEVRVYRPVVNLHREGILRLSTPLYNDEPVIEAQAREMITKVLTELSYVGVLAIETFDVEGQLIANEMAPRVHNSGHWTIEGAVTSQFENHLRAVCGLPLGDTACRGAVSMVNLIGELPPRESIVSIPGAHLHLYDKLPRSGRKCGHITVEGETLKELGKRLERLREILGVKHGF